jgi:hypothetical protein
VPRWLVATSCNTYHHISLPPRIAVGDTITLRFGSNPKDYAFPVARIDLDGQHCAIFSEAEGNPRIDNPGLPEVRAPEFRQGFSPAAAA